MNGEAALLAAGQFGLLTHAQLRSVGYSNKQIRDRVNAGYWERLERGLFSVAGTPPGWRRPLAAAVLAAGPRAAASRRSAAALWRLPGFPAGPINVTMPHSCDHEFQLGVLRRTCLLPERHVTTLDGIRVTTPARTLFDLAAIVGAKQLERAMNNGLAMRLVSVASLRSMLDTLAKRGRPGTAAFRHLVVKLEQASGTPESGLEDAFLQIVADAGLPMPEIQVVLGDQNEKIGRVDGFWRRQKVVAEVDSDRHHTAPLDQAADAVRDEKLGAIGITVKRFSEFRIRNLPHEVAAELREALGLVA